MSTPKVAFVLIHGGWHNRSAWNKVIPILEAEGHTVLTLDLPGAGANTIAPKSLGARPFDLAAFAAEPSSIAGVTLDERTQAVVALVNEAASLCDGKVILVGHSAGGMVISAVAEQVPELLAAAVYVAGFMVPSLSAPPTCGRSGISSPITAQRSAMFQHLAAASYLVLEVTLIVVTDGTCRRRASCGCAR